MYNNWVTDQLRIFNFCYIKYLFFFSASKAKYTFSDDEQSSDSDHSLHSNLGVAEDDNLPQKASFLDDDDNKPIK